MASVDGAVDLYGLLGVSRDAELDRIRRVYRERAMAVRIEATQDPANGERLRELTHAFEVLSNPHSRLLYDQLAFAGAELTEEWAEASDEELIDWVFGFEPSGAASPPGRSFPTGDLLVRGLASVGVVIAVFLLLAVLARG